MTYFSSILQSIGLTARRHDFIPSLEGAWAPNNRLEDASTVADIAEMDAVAVCADDRMAVSAGNAVLAIGDDGFPDVIATFSGKVTALAAAPDGSLFAAVENDAIHRLDFAGNTLQTIPALGDQPVRCVTALHADADGTLWVATGSDVHEAADWVHDLMRLGRTGRLHCIDQRGEARCIARNLGWPSGITRDDEGTLSVSLSWEHAVRRFGRDGKVLGDALSNLAGYPGRLHRGGDGRFWLAVFAMRTQLVDFVLREDRFRRDMIEQIDPEHWVRPALRTRNSYLEPLQGGSIKKLGITKAWAPPRSYGLVVELGTDFQPVRSFHSRVGGRMHGVTDVQPVGGDLLVVAKGPGLLARMTPGANDV